MKSRIFILVALAFFKLFLRLPRSPIRPLPRDILRCKRLCSWRFSTTTWCVSTNSRLKQQQHVKEAAKSAYFPSIRNESAFIHVTDTQLVEIGAGSLGTVAGAALFLRSPQSLIRVAATSPPAARS